MKRLRWALFGVVFLVSAVFAYLLRDAVYDLIIVPLAYTLWLLGVLYRAVPELVKWVVLIVVLFITVVWRLIPDLPTSRATAVAPRKIDGRLETLAIGIHRARGSNYFKWQLANRLGRLARHIADGSARAQDGQPGEAIGRYLAAGVNQSFVDFPTPRGLFARRLPTPLDLDPGETVGYLESQLELRHDGRTRSR